LRKVEIFPGVPKPEGRASGTNVNERSAKQSAAVRRAQEFSPKLCQENTARKEKRDRQIDALLRYSSGCDCGSTRPSSCVLATRGAGRGHRRPHENRRHGECFPGRAGAHSATVDGTSSPSDKAQTLRCPTAVPENAKLNPLFEACPRYQEPTGAHRENSDRGSTVMVIARSNDMRVHG
jgi:hypothetical protein